MNCPQYKCSDLLTVCLRCKYYTHIKDKNSIMLAALGKPAEQMYCQIVNAGWYHCCAIIYIVQTEPCVYEAKGVAPA